MSLTSIKIKGIANILLLVFKKEYVSNLHFYNWTKNSLFMFWKPFKVVGIYVIIVNDHFSLFSSNKSRVLWQMSILPQIDGALVGGRHCWLSKLQRLFLTLSLNCLKRLQTKLFQLNNIVSSIFWIFLPNTISNQELVRTKHIARKM